MYNKPRIMCLSLKLTKLTEETLKTLKIQKNWNPSSWVCFAYREEKLELALLWLRNSKWTRKYIWKPFFQRTTTRKHEMTQYDTASNASRGIRWIDTRTAIKKLACIQFRWHYFHQYNTYMHLSWGPFNAMVLANQVASRKRRKLGVSP